MRASDLIRELQCEIGVHGDLEIEIYDAETYLSNAGYHSIVSVQRVGSEFVLQREDD